MNSAALRKLAFGNPLIKAAALAGFALLGNILTGAYVSVIIRTEGGQTVIAWGDTPRTPLFWCLMALLIVMALYGWGMTVQESRTVEALANAELALAKARTAVADEQNAGLAAEYRRKVLEQMYERMMEHYEQQMAAGKLVPLDEIYRTMTIDRGGAL